MFERSGARHEQRLRVATLLGPLRFRIPGRGGGPMRHVATRASHGVGISQWICVYGGPCLPATSRCARG
eukprot:7507178-Pyramimonas_sp.AAC.1